MVLTHESISSAPFEQFLLIFFDNNCVTDQLWGVGRDGGGEEDPPVISIGHKVIEAEENMMLKKYVSCSHK